MTAELSDLEICRLCATLMGIKLWMRSRPEIMNGQVSTGVTYWPLNDREQALDLVIKLRPDICGYEDNFAVVLDYEGYSAHADNSDLLRAICLCASKIQLAKEKANV